MIWLLVTAIAFVGFVLLIVGWRSSETGKIRKYSLLIDFSLATFGAFVGFLFSLLAHDYLEERNSRREYRESLLGIREISIDHLLTLKDIQQKIILATASTDPDEDSIDTMSVISNLVFANEVRTAERASALVKRSAFLLVASSNYRNSIERILSSARLKLEYAPLISDIDVVFKDSLSTTRLLINTTLAELSHLDGDVSKSELDTMFRCSFDNRRMPRTEKGYDEYCSQDMYKIVDKLYYSPNAELHVRFKQDMKDLDKCVKNPEKVSFNLCEGAIRRLIQ